jgi:phosphohistidine swiveling domain-containing protein
MEMGTVLEKTNGVFTFENGIKVMAAIGAVTLGVATYKAFRNAYDKRQASKTTATNEKGETIEVEILDAETK